VVFKRVAVRESFGIVATVEEGVIIGVTLEVLVGSGFFSGSVGFSGTNGKREQTALFISPYWEQIVMT